MPRSRLACLLGYTALAKWLPQVPQSRQRPRFCACGGDVRGVRKEDRTPGRQDAEGASLQLQVQRDEPGQDWAKHGHKGRAAWSPETSAAYREKIKGRGIRAGGAG